MSNIVQDVQTTFTEFLAKLFSNSTFASQAAADLPAALRAEGIPESAVSELNVQQAITDACGYPGVPPSAGEYLGDGGGYQTPPAPPQSYQELVQQLQVVNNYVNNEVIDNSTTTTIGANFGVIDVATDNDVTQVGGDNEGAIGDNNEVAHIAVDAGGGDGGTATGGAGGAALGGNAASASSADGGSGGYGSGGDGGSGSGDYSPTLLGAGGDGGYGTGGDGGHGGNSASQATADASADGGAAQSTGGDGGFVAPIVVNFGDDVQEAGPGDQELGVPYRYDNDDPGERYDPEHERFERQDELSQPQF
jgi:hypothetical protein